MEGGNSLCRRLGDTLHGESADIIDELLNAPQRRGAVGQPRVCDELARARLASVLANLAAFICSEGAAPMAMDAFNTWTDQRRGQGESVQGLLNEFECLQHLLNLRLKRIAAADNGSGADALQASHLLNSGLNSLAFATIRHHYEQETGIDVSLSQRFEQFARSVGHQLRQPLQTLELCASLLRQQSDPAADAPHHCAKLIEDALARMADLLHDLQILAASERARTNDGWIGFHEVMAEITDQLSSLDAACQVQVSCDALEGVEFRRLPLQLALLSLVGYGIRSPAPRPGERRLEVSATWHPSRYSPWGVGEIRIAGGEGLETACQEFESGAGRGNAAAGEGGLGVWLTRQLLSLHGGSLAVTAGPGQGATCVLRLQGRALGAGDLESPGVDDLFGGLDHQRA